jgi:hypothetical protein
VTKEKWVILFIVIALIVCIFELKPKKEVMTTMLDRAYADGKSHLLANEFGSQAEAEKVFPFLKDYLSQNNVQWSDLENDFCVIMQSLISYKKVNLPKGDYVINEPIEQDDMHLSGAGKSQTRIIQKDINSPVLTVSGVPHISDMYLGHEAIPQLTSEVSKGAGIYIKKGLRDGSVIERLIVQNITSGIFLNDKANVHVYSSSIRDIRIARFNHSAIFFNSQGNTGNIFSNIYVVNWDNYEKKTKLKAPYGLFFKGFEEGIGMQLNVEHGLYGKGIVVSNSNLDLNSIHFEGYNASETNGAFFYIDGNSTITIRNSSIVYSEFNQDNTKDYAVLAVGGKSNVKIDSLRIRANAVVGDVKLRKFFGVNGIKETATINASRFYVYDDTFKNSDYFPISQTTNIVKSFNN